MRPLVNTPGIYGTGPTFRGCIQRVQNDVNASGKAARKPLKFAPHYRHPKAQHGVWIRPEKHHFNFTQSACADGNCVLHGCALPPSGKHPTALLHVRFPRPGVPHAGVSAAAHAARLDNRNCSNKNSR